jgi:deazaflavin-dependent oxidoreductase (nitroreductase family)
MAGIAETLTRAGTAASSSAIGGWLYHVLCRRIDKVLIPLTNGRLSMGPPGQTLLLTTRGAKSGQPRVASLAFLRRGTDMVIVASKGGADHHPGWYHNVKADPRVVVQSPTGIEDRVAREAVGEERDALFREMASKWSNFAAYQARATDRTIPVIVLSPVRDAGPPVRDAVPPVRDAGSEASAD